MAASDALLTWGGLQGKWWIDEIQEEEDVETTRARLQAMTVAALAKDAAMQDLQRRLQAALKEVDQGREEQAALRRRVEIAEAAEEALASQMGEVEAEAYARIQDSNKRLAALQGADQMSVGGRIEEVEWKLEAAEEAAAGWERRFKELEAEVEQGRAREAALLKRAQTAEAAEEGLASEMAELEAEAYTRITQLESRMNNSKETDNLMSEQPIEARETEIVEHRQVAELQRRLVEAERALEAAHTKLEEMKKADGKQVSVKRKGELGSEETLLSLSLQELAGKMKLRLWTPSSLTLASA